MKIVYISSIAFSDVDISMLMVAQKKADITYVGLLNSSNRRSCAIDLRESNIKVGFNKGIDIPQLYKYKNILDLSKVYMFCSDGKHAYDLNSIRNSYLLYDYIKKSNFDVVHITSVPSILDFFMFKLRSKIILTVHDPIPHSSSTYKMDKINRLWWFKFIKNLIILNKSQKEDFINKYHVNIKTCNIFESSLSSYNYLKIYANLDVPYSTPYILFFGNVTGYKGLDILLPAMIEANKKCSDLRLIVAGAGKFNFDISDYLDCDYITVINHFIPDDELSRMIRNSEFIIVPYIDATQSGVVMSAYAFNKPCIATNVGGLPEMVINGVYGEIVPPKEISSLSDAIVKLHSEPEMLRYYSENIEKDYSGGVKSWRFIVDDLINIYKKISQ